MTQQVHLKVVVGTAKLAMSPVCLFIMSKSEAAPQHGRGRVLQQKLLQRVSLALASQSSAHRLQPLASVPCWQGGVTGTESLSPHLQVPAAAWSTLFTLSALGNYNIAFNILESGMTFQRAMHG